jgi:hypothetical protein
MPRVQTTRTVRIVLLLLPVYLLVMMALILVKFVGSCRAAHVAPDDAVHGSAPAAPAAPHAPGHAAPHP